MCGCQLGPSEDAAALEPITNWDYTEGEFLAVKVFPGLGLRNYGHLAD